MSRVTLTEQYLQDTADAIREKTGGSSTITPAGFADAIAAISGGGSAHIVEGTFTVGEETSDPQTVAIPYDGNGYPIFFILTVDTGSGSSDYSGVIHRYAVLSFSAIKRDLTKYATYNGGSNDSAHASVLFKSSATAGTVSYAANASTKVYNTSLASTSLNCVRLSSKNTILFNIQNGSVYGLLPSATYRYLVVYSE